MGPDSAVGAVLGVPDAYEILAVLPFGYPVEHHRTDKKNRKPPAEVASRDRLGQPFS